MRMRFVSASILTWVFAVGTPYVFATEMSTKWPFAFVEEFPEVADALGFESGRRLSLGVFVIPGDFPVKSVTLTNVDSGETIEVPPHEHISGLFSTEESLPVLYNASPMPEFDPDRHMGVWEIVVTNTYGGTVVDETHDLDKADPLPFVTDLRASGLPLTPTITWEEPAPEAIPSWCRREYAVRLLKNVETQLHRSEPLSEGRYRVPDGVLEDEDLADTYVRVEFTCFDREDKDHSLPIESKSETFELLRDLLM